MTRRLRVHARGSDHRNRAAPLPGSGSRRSVALTVLVGAAAALAGGALQVELAGVRPPAGAAAHGSACPGGAEYEVGVARWGAALPGRRLLESDLVLDVVALLPITPSAKEERRIAARRATDLDQLRRLLDAEGESRPAPPPQAPPAGPGDGHSRLLDLLGPREAQADEVLPQIEAFLERYRRATEARDVAALGAMYETFSPEQRAALERYFGGVRDLRVAIDHVEAAVVGDEAAVTYARADDFVDVQTGRPGHVAVRLTKTFRRVDGRWLFAKSR